MGFIIKEMEGSKSSPETRIILKIMALTAARKRFVTGPAMATHIIPFTGSLKCKGFTGTGLAHPIIWVKKNTNVPIGSRCLIGFKVILPKSLAVGSPSLSATQPWAISWKVTARSIGTKSIAMSRITDSIKNNFWLHPAKWNYIDCKKDYTDFKSSS